MTLTMTTTTMACEVVVAAAAADEVVEVATVDQRHNVPGSKRRR